VPTALRGTRFQRAPWLGVSVMSKTSSIFLIAGMALSHILLFFIFMPITLQLDIPSWWYPLLGENAFSAISWMQISHSIGVVFAAVPFAIMIVLIYPHVKYRVAVLVASGLTLVIGLDLFRSVIDFGLQNSFGVRISHAIDVLKSVPLMVGLVFICSLFIHTNKKRNEMDGSVEPPIR